MPLKIELLVKPEKQMSGLYRYAGSLEVHLRELGLEVRRAQPEMPAWLKAAAWPFEVIGFDPRTFFSAYPVNAELRTGCLHHLLGDSLASILFFKRVKPAVITVQGLYGYVFRNAPELSSYRHLPERLFDLLSIAGLRRADALIAVSDFLKNILTEQIGISPKKVYVVPEGVDHATFRPRTAPDDFWQRHNLRRDRRYVLYVGSEQPGKNFNTLLRSFARLKGRLREASIHLLKVGRPEIAHEREKSLRLISELGIGEDVTFAGHVEAELPNFYNIAEIFVFPSLHEGFGLPPLEAMACGVPTICSSAGALPEVVGQAALLFKPLDEEALVAQMEALLLCAELRAEYTERGLQQAKKFDWTITAQRTLEVYQAVSQASSSPSVTCLVGYDRHV